MTEVYVCDDAHQEFRNISFNPDSTNGLEVTVQHLPYVLICEAYAVTHETDEFFTYLDDHAKTYSFAPSEDVIEEAMSRAAYRFSERNFDALRQLYEVARQQTEISVDEMIRSLACCAGEMVRSLTCCAKGGDVSCRECAYKPVQNVGGDCVLRLLEGAERMMRKLANGETV